MFLYSLLKMKIYIFDIVSCQGYYTCTAENFPMKMNTNTTVFGLFLITFVLKFSKIIRTNV